MLSRDWDSFYAGVSDLCKNKKKYVRKIGVTCTYHKFSVSLIVVYLLFAYLGVASFVMFAEVVRYDVVSVSSKTIAVHLIVYFVCHQIMPYYCYEIIRYDVVLFSYETIAVYSIVGYVFPGSVHEYFELYISVLSYCLI